MWYDTIKAFFVLNGFKILTLEDCLFYECYPDGTAIDDTIHVDDRFVTINIHIRATNMLRELEVAKLLSVKMPSMLTK